MSGVGYVVRNLVWIIDNNVKYTMDKEDIRLIKQFFYFFYFQY